jgi:hypothetical protein
MSERNNCGKFPPRFDECFLTTFDSEKKRDSRHALDNGKNIICFELAFETRMLRRLVQLSRKLSAAGEISRTLRARIYRADERIGFPNSFCSSAESRQSSDCRSERSEEIIFNLSQLFSANDTYGVLR